MQAFRFRFIALMNDDDDVMLSAYHRFEQHGGIPLFRADFTPVGRNRSFCGIVKTSRNLSFRFTNCKIHKMNPLGEALTEAIMQGLGRVVENEGFNVRDYSLLVVVHSNSFTHVLSQSARNVPLHEWLNNGEYTRAWLKDLANWVVEAKMGGKKEILGVVRGRQWSRKSGVQAPSKTEMTSAVHELLLR